MKAFHFERAVNSYSTNSNVENTVDSQEKQTLNSAQQKMLSSRTAITRYVLQ